MSFKVNSLLIFDQLPLKDQLDVHNICFNYLHHNCTSQPFHTSVHYLSLSCLSAKFTFHDYHLCHKQICRYKENWSFEICSWSGVCFELTNGWLFASLTFAKRGTCHVPPCARMAPLPFLCKPCFAWMICMHVRQCCKVLWQRQCYWPPFTPHTVSLVMTIGKTNEEVVEGKAFLHINSYEWKYINR